MNKITKDTHFHNLDVLNEQVTNLKVVDAEAKNITATNVDAENVDALFIGGGTITSTNNVNVGNNLNVENYVNVGNKIEFVNTVSSGYSPSTILNFVTSEDVGANEVLKVGSADFTVAKVKLGDDTNTPIIGVSINSANSGQIVRVCVSGVFKVKISQNITFGNRLQRSSTVDGQAEQDTINNGAFAVALQSGIAGSEISAMFQKTETY